MRDVRVFPTAVRTFAADMGGAFAWGTAVVLGVLVILDFAWAEFSSEAQTHPVITAIVAGVAAGLAAGMVLDRRTKERNQRRFAPQRGSAIIALADAAWRAYDLVPPVSTRGAAGPSPDVLFRGELDRWRDVLLALDEVDILDQCEAYREHLAGAALTAAPDLAINVLSEDLLRFTKEKERVEEARQHTAETAITQAIEASARLLDSREIAQAREAMNRMAERAERVARDQRGDTRD